MWVESSLHATKRPGRAGRNDLRHDGRVHYIESGTGPPLLLLHAFPVDARMWNGVRAQLEDQARVITPDQRGLGESALDAESTGERGDHQGAPSLDVVAADVLALMDTLGLREVILGGCSMGGYVAMAVLRQAPERVRGILLADTKAAEDNAEQRATRLAAADRAEGEGVDGWLPENALPGLIGRSTREGRPEVAATVRELIEAQGPQGVAWAQRAMACRPDSTGTLRSFAGPALVLSGAEDVLTPPETMRELATVLPAAELTILSGVGHLAPLEDPEAVAGAVRPWLSQFV